MTRPPVATAVALALSTLVASASAASLETTGAARQPTNWPAISIFTLFVVLTLFVTRWAAKRTSSAGAFYTGGGDLGGFRNGLALAGDFMSAAAFLGASAAVMINGFDGLIYLIGFMSGWPIMLFLLAERLRNLGRYTFADVVAYRLDERPLRIFASLSSLVIIICYLLTQMVGAGQLIQLLFGLDYKVAVTVVGVLMVVYVMFGGMAATTWVQIIKATMLLSGATYMALAVLWHYGFSVSALLSQAVDVKTQIAMKGGKTPEDAIKAGAAILAPGGFIGDPISALSFGMALMFGTAGLPHILMRFFTVPNAKEARRSVMWASIWMCYFTFVTVVIGFGAITLVLPDPQFLDAKGALAGGANMAAIHLAHAVGGKLFFGFMCAVAFSTILAVVAGLTLSGAATVSHDLYAKVFRTRGADQATEFKVSRLTTIALGLIAVLLGIAFQKQNIAYLVALTFSIAASANFPVLFMSVFWKRCTTRGALAGGYAGLGLALALTVASDPIWVKVLGNPSGTAPFPYASPALFSMAAAFAMVWLVSILDRSARSKVDQAGFVAQQVRSETGIGAFAAIAHTALAK